MAEKNKDLKDFIGKLDEAIDVITSFGNKLQDSLCAFDSEEIEAFMEEELNVSPRKKETKKERALRKEKAIKWLKERYPNISVTFDEAKALCEAIEFRLMDIEENRQDIEDKLESIKECEDEIERLKDEIRL